MADLTPNAQIILNGALGETFGRSHRLIASTPAQAIRGLCANFPDFHSAIAPLYIEIKNGGQILEPDQIHGPISNTLELTPAISGSGGFGKLLLGGALIGLSFALPGAGVAASVLTLSKGFLTLGIGLALQGVYELITPAGSQEEEAESSFFNQVRQNSRQGTPYPILIGEFSIDLSSAIVLSSGIDSVDAPVDGSSGKGGK